MIVISLKKHMEDHTQLTKAERLLLDWNEVSQPREVDEDEPTVKVHQMVKKLGWGFDKIRALMDQGHGHQDCYRAISRITKRLLLLEKKKVEKIPQLLVSELIRAGYLENDKTPKKDLDIVLDILDKYIVLIRKIFVKIDQAVINKLISKNHARNKKREISSWLVKLSAREVERFLLSKNKEEIIAKSMYDYIAEQIKIEDKSMSEHEKKTQIYIAVHRALLRSDEGILSYYLFKIQCPNWANANDDDLDIIAHKIFQIKENIDEKLHGSLGEKLKRICSRYVVYFILWSEMLNEIGAKEFAKLMDSPTALEAKITETVEKSYNNARTKIRKGMVRSTLYVFITKSASIRQGIDLNLLEFIAVLITGPIVMLLVGLSIRKPPQQNTDKIIQVFKRMIFQNQLRNVHITVKQQERHIILNIFFVFVYLIIFLSIILGIYWGLWLLGFSIVITSIALFFFSMISYFGFRLREIMREYVVLDKKENTIGFIFDFLALPILKLGRILAQIIDKINISIPILDYVIETPYKAFVNFFEHWTGFIRDKKEELHRGDE